MRTLSRRVTDFLRDIGTLFFIWRDPRLSSLAKAAAAGIVLYAVSPVDLLPDVIPGLGFLDDLLVIPAALELVRRLIPAAALATHRARADRVLARVSFVAVAAGLVALWAVGALLVVRYLT